MISASDYSQKLSISRIKIFNESFFQNIKINEYNREDKNVENKIKNNRSNKDLFKFIRAFEDLMLELFAIQTQIIN